MPTPVAERSTFVVHRPWTRAERRVVIRGLVGRLCIAVEPIICGLVFTGITVALLLVPNGTMSRAEAAIVLVPIFGFAAIAFAIYAVFLMVAPVTALLHTFSPIYIVDGYVRYRTPDHASEPDAGGYVAVLDADRLVISEWPLGSDAPLHNSIRAAHVEFSTYGGIHRIDGRSTGVLPETITPLGVGINR